MSDSEWARTRVGKVFKLQRGFDITGASHQEGAIPVISSGGFSGFNDRAMARGPGVVIGRKGTLGTVHYVETDYWPHDTTLFVCDFKNSIPRFVFYFLKSLRLEHFDVGAANPTLNRNHVHPLEVRWPDRYTQVQIAAYLDEKVQTIESLTAKLEKQIRQLDERQASLISAAVTGQIDVRGDPP